MNVLTTQRIQTDRGVQHPPPISISIETIRPMLEALGIVEEDWPRIDEITFEMPVRRLIVVRHRQFSGTQTRRVEDGKRLCEMFEVEVTR